MLLYASNGRLEGWGSLDVGGPVELVIWRSVSPLETAPMWVSPSQRENFWSWFFIKLFLEAPLDNRKNNFAKISIFSEILVFKGCFAMSASPQSKF